MSLPYMQHLWANGKIAMRAPCRRYDVEVLCFLYSPLTKNRIIRKLLYALLENVMSTILYTYSVSVSYHVYYSLCRYSNTKSF